MRKQKEFLIDVSDYSGAQVVDNDVFFTRDTDAYLIFRPTNTYINYDSALLYLVNIATGTKYLDLPTTKIDDSYVEFKLTPNILKTYGAWKGQILFQLNGSTAASSVFEFTVNRFLTDSIIAHN